MLNHTLKLDLDDDRHLIVGDIHGRYDMLEQLLEMANYDPAKDVVYSVGDMINRGPDSVKVIEFFQQERCYAIKGNHELMAADRDWWETWLAPHIGGLQCMDALGRHGYDHQWLKDQIRDLPWAIEVGEDGEEGAFRIIHAEMPAGWPDAFLRKTLNEAINHNDPTFAHTIWGRNLVNAATKNVYEEC